MGIENSNAGVPKEESYDENVAKEKLTDIVTEIKSKLAADPRYDVNGHWDAAVYHLSVALSQLDQASDLEDVLTQNGWSRDTFPQELL